MGCPLPRIRIRHDGPAYAQWRPAGKQIAVSLLERYFTGNTFDYKQIFAIVTPIFIDQLFVIVTGMLNTAMISSSGIAAVTAVSMVDALNLFIFNVFVALATGGTVIVAQYRGARNQDMVSRSASQAITVVTAASALIGLSVIAFHTPILHGLLGNSEPEVIRNAEIYLIGSCLTAPLLGVYQAVTGVLRGIAETKACLSLSIIMNLSFFLLNIAFVSLLDLGVTGLAIALFLARAAGAAASLMYLRKFGDVLHFQFKNALKLNVSIVRKMMYIGLPFAAEQMFFNGGKLLTQTFIVQFGTLAMTVNAIGSAYISVSQTGANALSIALVTVVGQCIGRKDIADAKKFVKSFLALCSLTMLIAALVLLPVYPVVVRWFSPPEEIIPEIFRICLLAAVAQPVLWSLSFLLPSALRAAGDSKFTSITSLITMWLVRVVLGYILAISFRLGVLGVWSAMVIEWGVRGALFAWRFRGEKWYRHKLI